MISTLITLCFVVQYGGNPVSCAVALAVLHTIEEEKLQEQALRVGNYWINKVKEMMRTFPIIGDVRLVKALSSLFLLICQQAPVLIS